MVVTIQLSICFSPQERRRSHQRMKESYAAMMEAYAEQKSLAGRQGWAPIKTRHAQEPDELTVTHINQTKDLFVSAEQGHLDYTYIHKRIQPRVESTNICVYKFL